MNEHETIADIIAEKRRRADEIEASSYRPHQFLRERIAELRQEADRLEAAHKRELSKNASKNGGDFGQLGDAAKLREATSTLRTALKEIRDDVLDMVMNHKSEDPDSYAHGLCLSIGGACDMALNSTKGLDYGNE